MYRLLYKSTCTKVDDNKYKVVEMLKFYIILAEEVRI